MSAILAKLNDLRRQMPRKSSETRRVSPLARANETCDTEITFAFDPTPLKPFIFNTMSILDPDSINRALRYLDDLYNATDTDEPYGEFVRASDLFFFSGRDQRALRADAVASMDALGGFGPHMDRLERLAGQRIVSSDTTSGLDSPLACFVVDTKTRSIRGNGAAQSLLGCDMPCSLSDLPFSQGSADDIRALIRSARELSFQGVRTLRLSFTHRDDVLVARCSKSAGFSTHDEDAVTLQFTLAYVIWTKELLAFATDEFGLTGAEVDVLQSLLSGLSQSQTATALGKSRETVKAQAKSILRKFDVSQMAEAQSMALAYAYLGQRDRVDLLAPNPPGGKAVSGNKLMTVEHLRSVDVWEYGDRDGFPVLFWHGLVLGPFFTPNMIDAFRRAGLRVICISRPGFGRSSPPVKWHDYDDTVTADAVAVANQLGLDRMAFWVHQAGISFACRAAGALKGRVLGAAMNGAGVPIQPHMLSKMNLTTRVAAATVLYAPKLLEVMIRHGFKSWRVNGPRQFYRQFFGNNGVEQKTLQDPEFARLFELGFLHTSAQVPEAMIWDGKSAMLNWIDAYAHFDFPQHWVHGDSDQILDADFVAAFLRQQGQPPLIVHEGFGTDLLYRGFDKVFPQTVAFFASVNPAGSCAADAALE